jgi:hypothetical protein
MMVKTGKYKPNPGRPKGVKNTKKKGARAK